MSQLYLEGYNITLDDKVKSAISLLREHEPAEGYYVAFSGGKDSQVIERLCKESGVKYDAHYNNTTIDPPELVRFIKAQSNRRKSEFMKTKKPKTVWVLPSESGSDYTVEGVFSTKKNANLAAKKLKEMSRMNYPNDPIEMEIDRCINSINKGFTPFRIGMLKDGAVRWVHRGIEMEDDSFTLMDDTFNAVVWARDEQHAIKIANEKRIQWLANNPGKAE